MKKQSEFLNHAAFLLHYSHIYDIIIVQSSKLSERIKHSVNLMSDLHLKVVYIGKRAI